MKKFITRSWNTEIEEIEITRETTKCYFFRPTWYPNAREERRLKDVDYHSTWEEAHFYLLSRTESQVRSAQSNLDRAKNSLESIKAMVPPQKVQP